MKKYKVVFKNNNEVTIPKFMVQQVTKDFSPKSVTLIEEKYDIDTLIKKVLSIGVITEETDKHWFVTFKRSCDIIYTKIIKSDTISSAPLVEFVIHQKGKTIGTTKEYLSLTHFYENYLKDYENFKYIKTLTLSIKEISKIKRKVCFLNKDGIRAYVDIKGCIYYAYKRNLPTKRQKEEYEKFHNNPDAVRVRWIEKEFNTTHSRWFTSEKIAREELQGEDITIQSRGCDMWSPDAIQIYTRLPYCNILQALENGTRPENIAWNWATNSLFSEYGTVLIIIKEYLNFYSKHELEKIKAIAEDIV